MNTRPPISTYIVRLLRHIATLAAITILVIALTRQCAGHGHTTTATADTLRDTITTRDTIYITAPSLLTTLTLPSRTATLPLATPAADTSTTTGSAIEASTDTIPRAQPTDSATVTIPIEQRHYQGDNYEAWVSGYQPSLDSLHLYTQTQHITNTITQRAPPKRWGLSIGVGVVATPRRIAPGLSLGLTYTLIHF